MTQGAQRAIRHPESRDALALARAKRRSEHAGRGSRFYDDLAWELDLVGRGADDALAFAADAVGIRERPPGSNSGPTIDDWCRAAGYKVPVPWCGCFVNACIMAGGLPSGAGWIGFPPAIVARARRGAGGWSWHAQGRPGDLALFDTRGGDPAVHVEIVRARLAPTRYSTYGGNTSAGDGSRLDGGTVARRDDRSTLGELRIVGFARPPWRS